MAPLTRANRTPRRKFLKGARTGTAANPMSGCFGSKKEPAKVPLLNCGPGHNLSMCIDGNGGTEARVIRGVY
jgi:hypothetical protein